MNPELTEAELFDLVRPLLGEPVPAAVRGAAAEAIRWRDPEASLAVLVEQSALAGAVRGGPARLLTFVCGDLTIEIEAGTSGGHVDLVGQVVPPGPARIDVEQPGGTTGAVADDLGRFTVARLRAGPTRIRCDRDGTVLRTEWTIL